MKKNYFDTINYTFTLKSLNKIYLLLILLISSSINAATYYSRATGNWNANTTWSTTSGGLAVGAGIYPVAGDIVIIERAFTVTVNITNATCASLQLGGTATNNAGTLTFSGTNPSLTVSGNVQLGASGNAARDGIITFTNTATLSAGSIILGGTGTTPAQGTITMTAGGTLNVGSLIVGAGSGTWNQGTGTVVLTATNTLPATIFTAFNNLTVSAGITTMGRALTVGGALSVNANTTLDLSTFALGSPTSVALECGAVTGSTISGTTGTLTLGGSVTVNDIGTGTSGATISCPVALGGARTFTVADDGSTATDLTISGVVSTSGSLLKAGSGTMVLSGTNTYSGATTISGGVLSIGADNNLGPSGSLIFNNGATLKTTALINPMTRAITFNTGGGTFDLGSSLWLSGAITGSGGFTTGGGDLILQRASGNNAIGTINVNSGRLFVFNGLNNINGSSINVQSGAILDFGITAATTVTNTMTFASGAGLANRGSGTLTVNTANATFPSSGTMMFNIDDQPTNSITVTGNYPTLTGNLTMQVGGYNATVGTTTINGVISGGFALNKTEIGKLSLAGANTYSGGTNVTAGTLGINSTTALGATTAPFSIANGAKADIVNNVTVGSLNLGGLGTANGTWGYPGSAATYTNSTYFTTTISGVINVLNDTRAIPTVTPTVGTYTYNGTPNGPTVATNTGTGTSYTFSYVGTGATTFGPTATRPTNAGTYTVTATVAASTDGFYKQSSSTTAFTINKAVLTITAGNQTVIYGTSSNTVKSVATYTVTGFVGADTSSVIGGSVTYTTPYTSSTAVGTSGVTITPVITSLTAANYSFIDVTGVITIVKAALTITASPQNKCFGTVLALGTTAFTTTGLPSNGDAITSVTLTSTGGYDTSLTQAPGSYTGNIVPSNPTGANFSASNYTITWGNGDLTINALPTAGLTSSDADNTFCAGTSVTFTATGGTNYNFRVEGSSVQNGTSATYTTSTLTNGQVVDVIVTNASGCTRTSSGITNTVHALPTTANAGPDQTVCGAGTNAITLAANTVASGETGVWTWTTATGNPAVTNPNAPNTTITLAPGTSSTFTWTITRGSCSTSDTVLITNNAVSPISGTLNVCVGGTTILSSSQSPANSGNWSSASPSVATVSNTGVVTGVSAGTSVITYINTFGCPSIATVTVSPVTVAGTVSSNQSICSGSSPSDIVLTGSTGAIHWQSSTNNSTFTDISGATASTLLSATMGTLTSTRYYRAVVKSGSCSSINSGVVMVTVSPVTVVGTVSANQSICSGSTPSDITLTGSTGSIQWQVSSDNNNFNNITSNGTGSTLYSWAMGSLTSTRYYRAVVTSGSCSSINSGVVTVTVSPTTVSGTVSSNQSICTNSTPSDITLTGSTGAIQWQSSTNNSTFSDISGATSSTLTSATIGVLTSTRYYRAVVKSGSCSAINSGVVTVTVSQATVAGTLTLTQGSATTCSGSNYTAFTLSGYTGNIIRWESSTDNFATAGIPIVNTNNTYGVNNITTDTYYRAVVQSGGCNVEYSNSVKVTIYGAMPAVGAISLNGILYPRNGATNYCPNTTAVFSIDPVANASSYTWVIPTGWSVISGQGTTTLTVTTGNASQSANIEVYATNLGCPQANQSYLYLYLGNPLPSAPTIGTITQPTCTVPTGSFTITNYNASYTYAATPSTGVMISGSTVTAPAGSYTITATSGSCTSGSSAPVVINPLTLVTWNGSNWSPGIPTINNRVEFNANYNSLTNSPVNVDACTCEVKSGANVTFNSGHTLKVVNELKVVGTLTFEDDASLVQVNDLASNSGNIIYKRVTSPLNRYDFTYWSSPVKDMTLGLPSVGLSPTTFYDKYFIYNNAWVSVPRSTPMLKGEGYSVRAPQTTAISGNPLPFLATFTGEPHNGEVKKTLAGNGVYLIGNPYPSAIDADQFLALNSSVLQGTLYFWTHNSPPSDAVAGDKRYNYTTNDYATYNRTGGVGNGPKAVAAITGGLPPSGKIASAQGFFAPASAAGGELVFNNSMRLSTGGAVLDNTQFFKLSTNSKTAKTTTTANTEKNRIWLNLTNSEGAFKQTLIGYVTGATNDYDGAFDGVTYDGNQFVDFYSVNNEVNLSIQGRALPFVKKDSVALGYKSTIKGDFKISIDQIDGSLATQNIFLEDKDLKVLHDLKKEAYTFSTEKGVFNNRFVLRYADKNAVDEVIVPEVPGKDSNAAVVVSVKNGEIKINATVAKLDKVILYDMAGRKLFQKNKVDTNILVIPNFVWNHQALVVDIVLTDGTKHSRKIIN